MYNADFVCTYPFYDSALLPHCSIQLDPEFIKEYIEECRNEDLINCLYNANLLESLKLSDYDEVKINLKIKELYAVLSNHDRFKECMIKMANKYISEDSYMGFMLLLSYDYFFLTHICICEYLKTGETSSLDKLEEYISTH